MHEEHGYCENGRLGVRLQLSLVGNRTLESDIPATGTDRDARDTGWDLPALRNNVPNRERVARQAERDIGRRSGWEKDTIETLQV